MALFGRRSKKNEPEAPAVAEPELSADEMQSRVRVRILPTDLAAHLGLDYAREVAPGLVASLCVDFPDHVESLPSVAVAAHDEQALFSAGFLNTMAEKLDLVSELEPGIYQLVGDSVFTASKVLGMDRLYGNALPAAPNGVLFGIPHRHLIIAHVLEGAEAIQAVTTISSAVAHFADDEGTGGPLSTDTYFYRDGLIDVVSTQDAEGKTHVNGSGRFGLALQELLAG